MVVQDFAISSRSNALASELSRDLRCQDLYKIRLKNAKISATSKNVKTSTLTSLNPEGALKLSPIDSDMDEKEFAMESVRDSSNRAGSQVFER